MPYMVKDVELLIYYVSDNNRVIDFWVFGQFGIFHAFALEWRLIYCWVP